MGWLDTIRRSSGCGASRLTLNLQGICLADAVVFNRNAKSMPIEEVDQDGSEDRWFEDRTHVVTAWDDGEFGVG